MPAYLTHAIMGNTIYNNAHKDESLFMVDLYKVYNECRINLEAIKEINQKGE